MFSFKMEYRWIINRTGTLPDGHTPDLTITRVLTVGCFTAAYLLDWPITSVILLYSVTLSAHYLFSLLMSLRVIPR